MEIPEATYPASNPRSDRSGETAPRRSEGATDASPSGDGAPDSGPILLFDGVCNLCNRTVDFVMPRDGGRHRFGSLQSPEGRRVLARAGLDPAYLDSIVLVEGDRVLAAADAVLEIGRHLTGPWRVLAAMGRWVPRGVRNALYTFVAGRRYRWFGRRDVCRLPTPEEAARFIERGGTAAAPPES